MGHTTSYGPWYYDHEEKCEHYHYGNDVYYERIVTHYERCQRCGFDNSYTSTQSKMECEGHN